VRTAAADRLDPRTARAVIAASVRPLAVETVGLGDAIGCVLAGPLWARNPLPAFDSSAMDGFAVRGPGPWQVLGTTLAGDPPGAPLPEGGAVAVATGAALPPGCDGVLRAEDAVREGSELIGPAPAGRDIRRRGEECAPWTPVLPTRTVITPGVLALAAALGYDELAVRRRPRVQLLLTGREVLTSGDPGDGRIRDALGPLIVPSLRAAGAEPVGSEHTGDDEQLLLDAVRAAAGTVDLVLTTGGTAAGPTDRVRAVLGHLDVRPVIDGLGSRPGRPTMLGLLPAGVPVLNLPGNPLAALAGLVLVGLPVLAALQDRPAPSARTATLTAPVAAHPRDTRVEPVRRLGGAALPLGRSVGGGGSGGVRASALADGLALVAPGTDLVAGDPVDVLDLPGAAAAG
jgi:molybdopterin molybdotransferase